MKQALTDRQTYWLKHIQAAERSGYALSVYAQQQGLSAGALYNAKSVLRAIGAIEAADNNKHTIDNDTAASSFLAVKIEPERAVIACELTHASGWTLKFSAVPSVEWLRTLVGVGHDAAP